MLDQCGKLRASCLGANHPDTTETLSELSTRKQESSDQSLVRDSSLKVNISSSRGVPSRKDCFFPTRNVSHPLKLDNPLEGFHPILSSLRASNTATKRGQDDDDDDLD